MTWRGRLMLALAVVGLITGLYVALALAVYRSQDRDEVAFLDEIGDLWLVESRELPRDLALRGATDYRLNRFATERSVLLAKGDAACEWLETQRPAVSKPGSSVSDRSLFTRYKFFLADQDPSDNLDRRGLAPRIRSSGELAVTAWRHLCGQTYQALKWSHPWEPLIPDDFVKHPD